MKNIKKYLLFAFLIENIAALTSLFGGLTYFLFYGFLFLGCVLLFSKNMFSNKTLKTYWWAYILSLIYIIYEFTIGFDYINTRNLTYLVAKITTFIIIIVGVKTNYEFYLRKMPYLLALVMCFFVIYGLIYNVDSSVGERMNLGYGNPNVTSWMGALSVGIVLFSRNKNRLTNIVIILVGTIGMLAGASRAAFVLMAFLLLARYGLKPKLLLSLALGWIIAVYIIPSFNLDLVGLQRLQNTIDGTEMSNRDDERLATMMMIEEKPWTGWGFEAANEGRAALISELGSHSGYLDTIKFMGYPLGGAWLTIVVFSTLLLSFNIYRKKKEFSIYCGYALSILVVAHFESYFVGVHEFATNFYFLSLAMMSASLSQGEKKRRLS